VSSIYISNPLINLLTSALDPDRYTIVPANLKIIKVLVEELHSAAGSRHELEAAALEQLDEADSDDGEWEDDPDTLDLGSLATRQGKFVFSHSVPLTDLGFDAELMSYASDDAPARQRDDETQAYLIQFFREVAAKPGFGEIFEALTPDEKDKLRSFG
jgi:importin-9